MVMAGVPPPMVEALRRRRASHVWNASVDVLRRTRRIVHTIRGAAPDVNIGRLAADRAGARPISIYLIFRCYSHPFQLSWTLGSVLREVLAKQGLVIGQISEGKWHR